MKKNLSYYLANTVLTQDHLMDHEQYLAHIPKAEDHKDKKAETLAEHLELVLKHAVNIVELHGMDAVVDRLASDIVLQLHFEQPDVATDWIIRLFANAIAFHDFGKVNEFFQTDRMQNKYDRFLKPAPEVFTPKHGHSELGGYIYAVYHIENIKDEVVDEADCLKLAALALFFSNTILLHHSSKLRQPIERIKGCQFIQHREQLERFLHLYKGFPLPDLAEKCFTHFDNLMDGFKEEQTGFSLFAILRLNFSILTASDYMATWHYGYEMGLSTDRHWGVFSKPAQKALMHAAQTSKSFNKAAYQIGNQSDLALVHPTEQSEANLNQLRLEMSVEVIRQLQQSPDKRLFYLEAPTGGGKTNLSMLAVAELMKQNPALNKVYYVFPFTTLITQTHKAIQETLHLHPDDIALLHSRIGFQTASDQEDLNDGAYGNNKRDFLQNLFVLYPFTLLTHIRFLDMLKSNRKDDIYLMHRLANSIIVLDELQSYPPKQWDKLLYLLEQYGRYFNIRFILMSATLPRLDKIKSVHRATNGTIPPFSDLLPDAKKYFLNPNFKNRVSFRFDLLDNHQGFINLTELAAFVLKKSAERVEKAENEGRVFTIIEFIFKKSATEFKNIISEQAPFFDHILVLSGTILESRRKEIISFLKRNQKEKNIKVLLITTQVVEAGVDIDMDLGFKNISLIDSDEQLAGRVNRNVRKQDCEVYLFKANEPVTIYGEDFRYEAMRTMPSNERRQLLEEKSFDKMYDLVFETIEKMNHSKVAENFQHDYLALFRDLEFRKVHEKLKLIEQQNLSIFVPLELPLHTINEHGEQEAFFTSNEVNFIKKAAILMPNAQTVDGSRVWKLYRTITLNQLKAEDFVASKIEQKTLQGILSKFTFSTFDNPKTKLGLRSFCDPDDCFENYFILTRHQDLYDINSGLDESKLENPDIFF